MLFCQNTTSGALSRAGKSHSIVHRSYLTSQRVNTTFRHPRLTSPLLQCKRSADLHALYVLGSSWHRHSRLWSILTTYHTSLFGTPGTSTQGAGAVLLSKPQEIYSDLENFVRVYCMDISSVRNCILGGNIRGIAWVECSNIAKATKNLF